MFETVSRGLGRVRFSGRAALFALAVVSSWEHSPLRSGSFDMRLACAEAHVSQIPMLLRMHRPDAALEEAKVAVFIDPQAPQLQASLGGVLLQLGRFDEARQAFAQAMQQAREHRPNDESSQIAAQIERFTIPQP